MTTLARIPDADEAREWAERELADPVYRAAEPTAFDRAALRPGILHFGLGAFHRAHQAVATQAAVTTSAARPPSVAEAAVTPTANSVS